MRNLVHHENVAVVAFRQQSQDGFHHAVVTNKLGDKNAVSLRTREINFYFPLWIYPEDDSLGLAVDPVPNIDPSALGRLVTVIESDVAPGGQSPLPLAPEDVLHYVYAVLYSQGYRRRYGDYLRSDFPRIPLSPTAPLLRDLARLGHQLVALHLLDVPSSAARAVKLEGHAPAEVTRVAWENGSVWLNESQTSGFVGVPREVWEFQIGGYQVCEKWLKDRRGRPLSADDVAHYQKIIAAISGTIGLMNEIDEVIVGTAAGRGIHIRGS